MKTYRVYCHNASLDDTFPTLTAAVERAHVHIRHECVRGPAEGLRSIRWADDTALRLTWIAPTARRWVAMLYRGEIGSPEYVDLNHVIGLMTGEGEDDPREVVRRHGRRSEHPWFTYDSVDELLHELELTREDLGEALTTYARRTAAGYPRGDGPCGDRKVQARGRWWHPLENRWVEGDVELSDEAATSATREATRCLSIAEEFAENERVRREFADAVWDELGKVSIRRGGVEYPLTDAQRAAREWWVNRKIDVESDDDEETKR